jgi:hypothetical protein
MKGGASKCRDIPGIDPARHDTAASMKDGAGKRRNLKHQVSWMLALILP